MQEVTVMRITILGKKLSINFFSISALLITLLYYSLLSNFSFLPLTEGWFSAYAHLVINGKIPYKDFYLYLTPLYVWVITLISYIFGPSLFVLRVFGVLITCSIGLLLFRIFRFKFSPSSSFVGATIATFYYQSGNAYISYDFTQILTLFSLLSYNLLLVAEQTIKSLDRLDANQKPDLTNAYISLFLSGFFSICAFLTKQSNGSFIVIFTFLACIYLTQSSKMDAHHKFKFVLYFLFGGLLPVILVATYLALNQALPQFIDQIFFNSISAKGNLTKILSGWIQGVFTPVLIIQLYEIARVLLVVFISANFIFWMIKHSGYLRDTYNKFQCYREAFVLAVFFSLLMAILFFSWQDDAFLRNQFFQPGRHLLNYLIPLAISWTLIQLALTPLSHAIPAYIKIDKGTTILAICVLGQFFGNGTSAGLSEISSFIVIGWIASWLCNRGSIPLFGIWLAFYCCALLSTTLIYKKFDHPYAWWGVSEPSAREASLQISNPIQRGIYISRGTEETFSSAINVLTLINADSIFSFPNIPIFYLITNKWPDSKAIITWFDFLNDKDAIAESNRLRSDPPDAIIYLDLPEVAWKAHERLFRDGKKLGQREIQAWIVEACVLEKGYKIQLKKAVDSETTLYICKKISKT